jgi:UDP-N-acetylglucosamine--N-acetylmuramyl-(pentapeptide) pyrophosphoryl-undecaprenol N-acetylglucosamine transferase
VKVLILGGSQGARTLNHALPVALAALTNSVQVLHQAGRGNAEQVAALYRQHCPELKVQVLEFIDDMPQALIQSDLVVSRSGASAVSEICAIGRPSVLIPFEFAADNHQLHNALALQGCGAAVCIEGKDVTSESFAASLGQLIGNPEELRKMAQAARNWGRPMAAQAVARDLLQLAGLMRFGAVRPGEIDSPDENQDTQSAARNDKAMPRSAQLLGAI